MMMIQTIKKRGQVPKKTQPLSQNEKVVIVAKAMMTVKSFCGPVLEIVASTRDALDPVAVDQIAGNRWTVGESGGLLSGMKQDTNHHSVSLRGCAKPGSGGTYPGVSKEQEPSDRLPTWSKNEKQGHCSAVPVIRERQHTHQNIVGRRWVASGVKRRGVDRLRRWRKAKASQVAKLKIFSHYNFQLPLIRA